jgi:hypothetical protein
MATTLREMPRVSAILPVLFLATFPSVVSYGTGTESQPCLAMGASHGCALLSIKDIKCWGRILDPPLKKMRFIILR